MIKLHKRHLEGIPASPEPPCPQHRIQFLDSPQKKTRMADPNVLPDAADAEGAARSPQAPAALPVRPESPFVASKRVVTNDDVLALRPKRARLPIAAPLAPTQEKAFSVEDVRAIVQRAIDEHEAYIRNEYTRVLQERLNEQYASFARFNQDAISRQLQQSTWNYMS